MGTLNPTILRDSIKEAKATKDLTGISHAEQRMIIHRIYTRKVKEFSALYPVVFAVENALRSKLADFLAVHFNRMDWWVLIRDAIRQGHDHTHFVNGNICGKPATQSFIKQAFFAMDKVLNVQQMAGRVTGQDRTDEFYYCLTIGELARLMETDWSRIRQMFRNDATIGFKLDLHAFKTNIGLLRDARNELYHSNPIKNRPQVFQASERILNALDFHLGDYDNDLRDTQYTRVTATVIRVDRHLLPAR
ncbi:conserved hypothetical protein [Mesorhizobium plurifarium]|uniref:Uncharacterized protein n=1 Tax=Mesorhizobium plurifarium TaxID=69974 RepID=A0A0K2W2S4_MESPL|nr:conserved hypothetical protein [Mesorhizobium plurifarium]